MDERTELAEILGKHFGTSAAGDDYLWAMADILMERGWRKGREEWAFVDNAGSTIWPLLPNTEAEAERVRATHSGGQVIRRYVVDPTDWEVI